MLISSSSRYSIYKVPCRSQARSRSPQLCYLSTSCRICQALFQVFSNSFLCRSPSRSEPFIRQPLNVTTEAPVCQALFSCFPEFLSASFVLFRCLATASIYYHASTSLSSFIFTFSQNSTNVYASSILTKYSLPALDIPTGIWYDEPNQNTQEVPYAYRILHWRQHCHLQ